MLYVEAPGTNCHNDNYKTYSTSSYLYYIRLYMQLACHYLMSFYLLHSSCVFIGQKTIKFRRINFQQV